MHLHLPKQQGSLKDPKLVIPSTLLATAPTTIKAGSSIRWPSWQQACRSPGKEGSQQTQQPRKDADAMLCSPRPHPPA